MTETYRFSGMMRVKLSNMINGYAGSLPEMAVGLAKAFGSGFETWLDSGGSPQLGVDGIRRPMRTAVSSAPRSLPPGSDLAHTVS